MLFSFRSIHFIFICCLILLHGFRLCVIESHWQPQQYKQTKWNGILLMPNWDRLCNSLHSDMRIYTEMWNLIYLMPKLVKNECLSKSSCLIVLSLSINYDKQCIQNCMQTPMFVNWMPIFANAVAATVLLPMMFVVFVFTSNIRFYRNNNLFMNKSHSKSKLLLVLSFTQQSQNTFMRKWCVCSFVCVSIFSRNNFLWFVDFHWKQKLKLKQI